MQPDEITLSVDLLNTGILTDIDYRRVEEYLNRSSYISEEHEPGKRDTLAFYRTPYKSTSTFKGTRKTSVKFTVDEDVLAPDGTTTSAPAIIEVNFSIPVGVTAAQILVYRQRLIALLDSDTIMDDLNVLQLI